MPAPADPKERLIVALDYPNSKAALTLIAQLEGLVSFYKVGLELFAAGGTDLVEALLAQGKKVFLDLKFLDIQETVRRATKQVARLGVQFLTVHESGRVVAAAVRGAEGSNTKILAVTLLTDMDAEEMRAMGYAGSTEDLVLSRARRALAAGAHGVIASGQEARQIRALSQEAIIVTPGIRPAGTAAGDQLRTATPAEAIAAGADYIVVGRPIRDAKDPYAAAQQIINEIQLA
ncbi:MAG TPA: orotidine-5'-phosphate decarboxylase [Terriglobia bacterium]|nr:orotidine-5'-phosphate decarboxylase [Terriglobia bacterium]